MSEFVEPPVYVYLLDQVGYDQRGGDATPFDTLAGAIAAAGPTVQFRAVESDDGGEELEWVEQKHGSYGDLWIIQRRRVRR
jgi:hypothetical protein